MLVFSRKANERSIIKAPGGDVIVTVLQIKGGRVRLGFEAPREWLIMREEILQSDPIVRANEV